MEWPAHLPLIGGGGVSFVTTTFKQLVQEPRQEEQPFSHNTLSRSRPEKEAELMGNCFESKMRLRHDGEK